jgi:hypothetical protein
VVDAAPVGDADVGASGGLRPTRRLLRTHQIPQVLGRGVAPLSGCLADSTGTEDAGFLRERAGLTPPMGAPHGATW